MIKNKEKGILAGNQQKLQSIVTYKSVFWSYLMDLKVIPEEAVGWKVGFSKAN